MWAVRAALSSMTSASARASNCAPMTVCAWVPELQLVDPARSKTHTEQAARWYLQVIKGEHEGKKFHINGSMTLGRSVKCELCFSDQELSRRHCEFFLKDDVLEVKDLASANGLLVNQQQA